MLITIDKRIPLDDYGLRITCLMDTYSLQEAIWTAGQRPAADGVNLG
jgi:hypothetical protein